MKYRHEGPIATLEFDSPSEFAEWVSARAQRAKSRFPEAIETVGAIGPTSVSRIALDAETQVAATFEKFTGRMGNEVATLRMPLAAEFSILQLEVRDTATGMIHQWNFGLASDFDRLDQRLASAEPAASAIVGDEFNLAKAIVDFGLAYRALGRSRQFAISAVPQTALRETRTLFAGFCPRCDGVLERTGLKVEEHDNQTVLWEERCLDCDQRLLGWRKGDGQAPTNWKGASSREGPPRGQPTKPWWKFW